MTPEQQFEWAIVEANGNVVDRYNTQADAYGALMTICGYPQGSKVKRVPHPVAS